MNKRLARWPQGILAGTLVAALGGCTAATTRAPVVERSTGTVATTAAPAAAPAAAASYTVRKNDTLYSIAWRHNLDYKTLAAANRIEPPYTIYPGRRLSLPGPGAAPPAAPAPAAAPALPVAKRDARPAPRPAEKPPASRQPAPRPTAQNNKAPATTQAPARRAVAAAATKTPQPPPALPAKPKATAAAPPRPAAPKPRGRPSTPKPPAASRLWRPPVAAKPTRRFGGASKGYDYALAPATTVRAAAPGEVVYAGPGLGGFRHLVIVKASERYLVAYGINVAPKLKEGETVALGAPVAEIGSGGSAAGRFHFEIRDRGKPVDPGPLLGGA